MQSIQQLPRKAFGKRRALRSRNEAIPADHQGTWTGEDPSSGKKV
jgi:hypothetical protein